VTFSLFIKRYWRIGIAAVLAAMLAFLASFAVGPKYVSTSRMLLVEDSTTSLSSTGQSIGNEAGTPGASGLAGALNAPGLAQTLSETQAGLVSSRQVATMIVNQLHLDKAQPSSGGPIHLLVHGLGSVYHHIKALVTYGTYVTLPAKEQAIQTVQSSVGAIDLAPAGGPDTGQADSFILEISAAGNTAVQAQQIANAASRDLIVISRRRFTEDSQAYAKALNTQLNDANATLAKDNQAVSNYETANHITTADVETVQNVQNPGSLGAQLVSENAAVQGEQQTVSSLQATLATTAPTQTTDQNITTGRSTTGDSTTAANPVYQTVEEQLSQAQATLASDAAQAKSLQSQLQSNPSQALTQAEAGLLDLNEKVTADQNSVQSLSTALHQADANISVSPAELSQLAGASLPAYPASPKRYLYLILGLLLGGLAGAGLTYQARRRRAQTASDGVPMHRAYGDVDGNGFTPNDPVTEEYVGAPAGPADLDPLNGNERHGRTST
jgi:uncharacterized protein involved in exopolysaccharide biosynthesis